MTTEYTQTPNTCPKCKGIDIEWYGSEIDGDYCIYTARCNACECEFNEIYELKFIEQEVL